MPYCHRPFDTRYRSRQNLGPAVGKWIPLMAATLGRSPALPHSQLLSLRGSAELDFGNLEHHKMEIDRDVTMQDEQTAEQR